jgi:hypothetical protein
MHFISFAPLARHREGRGRIYRKIAAAVADKTFGIAGLPAELDQLSFSRNPPRNARVVAAAGHLART